MNGSLRIDTRRPPLRLALLSAAAAAVLAAAFALQNGDDAPRATPGPPSATPSTDRVEAARGDAPFPELDLRLRDVTPEGAVIALAARPGRYAVGQVVFPGVVVHHIDRDSVTLRFGSRERTLVREAAHPVPLATAATPFATRSTAPGGNTPAEPARIDPVLLSQARPLAARVFLDEVQVHADPRGGFVVDRVLPGSRYDRMGLRAGDVVFTLDTPAMRTVDETSMVALMQQTELELDIYRAGMPVRLRVALNADAPEAPDEAAAVR